ncbi:MAG: dephospho-CoA kinase [Clostridia bacterium]
MKLFGLTGNIASGKTAVARRLVALGAYVIDADDVSRELVLPGSPMLIDIIQRFGPEFIYEDGTLNRRALADSVFADAEALRALNGITHHAVIARMHEVAQAHASRYPQDVIFMDMALLIEVGEHTRMDKVWLVTAPEKVRIARIMERDGCSEHQARVRMDAQMPQEQKLCFADVIIDNCGSMDELYERVDALYGALC